MWFVLRHLLYPRQHLPLRMKACFHQETGELRLRAVVWFLLSRLTTGTCPSDYPWQVYLNRPCLLSRHSTTAAHMIVSLTSASTNLSVVKNLKITNPREATPFARKAHPCQRQRVKKNVMLQLPRKLQCLNRVSITVHTVTSYSTILPCFIFTKVCIRQRRKTRSCVHRVIDVARIVSSLCSTWCGTLNILTQFQTTNHLKITIYHKWLVCILNNGKFKNYFVVLL
jgi:hypothetical protein